MGGGGHIGLTPLRALRHKRGVFAPRKALSCEITLPGSPLAKASPQLQEKLSHVKARNLNGLAGGNKAKR